MAQKEFTIDTRQLDALSAELAVMPRDVLGAMRSSLVIGIRSSLTKVASRHYAIDPKTMGRTFRILEHRVGDASSAGMAFEVAGRRLTLSHFGFSPRQSGAASPTVEVIRGQTKRASPQVGADGKQKTPFVGSTGAKGSGKTALNVFVRTGIRSRKKNPVRIGPVTFRARREAIRSYRTVSVPQMLGHDAVAEDIQDNLLRLFDKNLFRRIESRTGLMQQNITSG